MGTRGEFHQKCVPRGVCDTVDGDNVPAGAMASLINLIPDPSTPGVYVCRPANMATIDFSTWGAAPGTVDVITAGYQVGDIIYGLVGITTGAYAGKDYPFAYNTLTAAFLPVTGITVPNCPVSQATAGAWTPPQMSLTGIKLNIAHVGYDGVTYFFGTFDVTLPTLPTYTAGNTTTHLLPSVPQAVQTFNNRTYFMCGSTAYYTDTLTLNMTNANQSETIGDYTPVTAFAPLPVGTTSQAIIQGLLAFKANKIFLITGDATSNDLGTNEISPNVGTTAPRTVVPTPEGVRFMANDGSRYINFFGALSEPHPDLALPFIYALTPSRACAAYNADIYRICVQNGNAATSPYQDYWLKLSTKSWTGPHSFQYDLGLPLGSDFIIASNTIPAKMWGSYVVQNRGGNGTTFTENGSALSFVYSPAPMTDLDNIFANSANRTTLEMSLPAQGQTYNATAQNEDGTVLATATLTEPTNQAIWGSFNWGAKNWGASTTGLKPITLPWNQAVVFNKLSIIFAGPSLLGFKIGTLHNNYKRLNYLLN